MVSDITVNGVTAQTGPGVFVQLTVPGSQDGSATAEYTALLVGNGLASSLANTVATLGTGVIAGPNSTLYPINTVQDIITFAGAGSPLQLAYSAFRSVNTSTPLSVMPIEVATGGTAASQTLTITAAGSPTQVSGVIQYSVGGQAPSQANFLGGSAPDSASAIATKLAAAINSNQFLPVTAAASSNTVVVTAKVANARGNFLRGFAQVVAGAGVTVTVTSPTFFTGGAGSDASIGGGGGYLQQFNALSQTVTRNYYVVPECGFDSVDGYNQVSHSFSTGAVAYVQGYIDEVAVPAIGIRQRAVFGSVDTVGYTEQTALDADDIRCEVVLLPNSDIGPFNLVANWAACISLFETVPLGPQGVNFDNFGGDPGSVSFWTVPAPLDGSVMSTASLQSCINAGVTPVKVVSGTQRTVVLQRVTSYFYPPSSPTLLDLRAQDAGMITICDRFYDDVQDAFVAKTSRSLIGAEPPAGSPPAPPGVVTVSVANDIVTQVINQYAAAYLINGPQTLNSLVVQQNTVNANSIGVRLTLFTSNLLHQVLINGSGLPALVV